MNEEYLQFTKEREIFWIIFLGFLQKYFESAILILQKPVTRSTGVINHFLVGVAN